MSLRHAALATALLALASACAPASAGSSTPPRTAAPAASPAARVATVPPTSNPGKLITLGDFTYADYGMRDLRGKSSQGVDAGDFYFKGTFLQGNPGQTIQLQIRNVAREPHNFSLPSQGIDVDIPLGGKRVELGVRLPESGALLFFCKLHSAQGMNGQLLAGEAEPTPLSGAQGPAPASSPSPAAGL